MKQHFTSHIQCQYDDTSRFCGLYTTFMIIFTGIFLVSCAPSNDTIQSSSKTQQPSSTTTYTETSEVSAWGFYNPDHQQYEIGVEEVDALCSIYTVISSRNIRASCSNTDWKKVVKEDKNGHQTAVQDDEDVDQNGIYNEDKIASTVLYKDEPGFYDFLDMSEMDANIYYGNSISIGESISVQGFTIENNNGNLIITSPDNKKVRIEKDKIVFYQ